MKSFPFLVASFGVCAAVAASAAEKKPSGKTTVSFYCASFDTPLSYGKTKQGGTGVVPSPPGMKPPLSLLIDEKGFKDKPLSVGGERISEPFTLPAEILRKGRLPLLSVETDFEVSGDSQGVHVATNSRNLSLGDAPVLADKPQLVFLFQPNISGRWSPPKFLVADLSPEAFPAGSCMIVNLGKPDLFALIGEKGAPVKLPSGSCRVIPAIERDGEDRALLRVSQQSLRGQRTVINALQAFPKARRTLVIVRSTNPAVIPGPPYACKIVMLDESPPAK